jgi:hypothetical protein
MPKALAYNVTLTSCTHVVANHNLAYEEFWMQEAVGAIISDHIVYQCNLRPRTQQRLHGIQHPDHQVYPCTSAGGVVHHHDNQTKTSL